MTIRSLRRRPISNAVWLAGRGDVIGVPDRKSRARAGRDDIAPITDSQAVLPSRVVGH